LFLALYRTPNLVNHIQLLVSGDWSTPGHQHYRTGIHIAVSDRKCYYLVYNYIFEIAN